MLRKRQCRNSKCIIYIIGSGESNGVRRARVVLCVLYIPARWTRLNKMFTHVMCVSKCHETRDFTLGRHARAWWRRVFLKATVPRTRATSSHERPSPRRDVAWRGCVLFSFMRTPSDGGFGFLGLYSKRNE